MRSFFNELYESDFDVILDEYKSNIVSLDTQDLDKVPYIYSYYNEGFCSWPKELVELHIKYHYIHPVNRFNVSFALGDAAGIQYINKRKIKNQQNRSNKKQKISKLVPFLFYVYPF